MKEVFSKGEDCRWLAQELKNQMDSYISFNKFGIDNPVLTGVYDKKRIGGPCVRFYIKFCKGEFLRIQIDIGDNNNENIAAAMTELINALANIKQDDNPIIGFPLAIYKVENILTSEYVFKNQEEVIEALKNNTRYADDDIEDLRFLRTCKNCHYGSYSNETLYCTYGIPDMETREDETCIEHEYEEGEEAIIKELCSSILR